MTIFKQDKRKPFLDNTNKRHFQTRQSTIFRQYKQKPFLNNTNKKFFRQDKQPFLDNKD